MANEFIWKRRFENLKNAIGELNDDIEGGKFNDDKPSLDDEPWSGSKEFFISNDLEVCDNEKFAKDHWGPGKYFKTVRVEN